MISVVFPLLAIVTAPKDSPVQWGNIPLVISSSPKGTISAVSWQSPNGEDWRIEWNLDSNEKVISLIVKGQGSSKVVKCAFGPYEVNSPSGSPFLSEKSLKSFYAMDWEIFCLRMGTGAVGIPVSNFVCVVHHKPTNKVFYEYGLADSEDFIQLKSKTHPVFAFRSRDSTNDFSETTTVAYAIVNGKVMRSTTTKSVNRVP